MRVVTERPDAPAQTSQAAGLGREMTAPPPADRLSPGRLATLWGRYNLTAVQAGHRSPTGDTHATWILTLADDRRVVLRRYHPAFDDEAVRYEHSILGHLAGCGFPVARIIPAAAGASYVTVDGDRWAVFEYCEGSPRSHFLLRRFDRAFVASAAGLLARHHRLMEGFTPQGGKLKRDGGWFCGELDRLSDRVRAAHGPAWRRRFLLARCAALKADLQRVGARLAGQPDGRYPATIIHGDFGPSHLLVRNGRIRAVLDFANARCDMRVADVGRSLVEFSKGPGPWLDARVARAFLRSYQAVNPLTDGELALLPAWMLQWRLISLYYALKRYGARGDTQSAARAVWNLAFVRWLKANGARVARIASPMEPAR